jgi:POT family proton-dependent oligopeptide transporter
MEIENSKTFFGHPRGLATLFFTEMWERFSYYGMRALLFLFMVATIEKGGLGMDEKTAGAIYGLYTMFVYLLALPGGWLADRVFGLKNAVFYGGCLITIGHFCMAIPMTETFFLGLLLIVLGTGLLKPNISSLVGTLYRHDEQAKRDAGFSIFYMGINVGATISPFITGYLGENINWHYGFAVAGLGMVFGLIQFKLTDKYLGVTGEKPVQESPEADKKLRRGLTVASALLIIFVALLFTRTINIDPVVFAKASGYLIISSVVIYFIYIFLFGKLVGEERNKVGAIAVFFIACATFYAGFEQQGSSLNLFAERYTDMFIGSFEMPASWMQSVPTIFVVIFVPVFSWLWVWLAKRNMNPSTPVKFSLGLIFMGLGYAVMIGASLIVVNGEKPLPTWLALTYLLHTFGEICLYPIGLSAVTKLSPQRLVGQMMGIWFMSLAFGNLMAGLFAGEFDKNAIAQNPSLLIDLFAIVMKGMLIAGVIALVLSKPIRKLMGDIR